jgi:hypothetical protein
MKVKISYTVEVDDEMREAINFYYGETGLATRSDIRHWFMLNGETLNDDAITRLYKHRNAVMTSGKEDD